MSIITEISMTAISALATLFVFMIGVAVVVVVILFVCDVIQTGDAVRRNYPVIGRFRHFFSTLGEFFRQYFFAMDREEMPFNRAERDWIYRLSVRRHINWNTEQSDLKEDLAHLVCYFKRRICGIASAGSPLFFV
jgi:hypothetical protein